MKGFGGKCDDENVEIDIFDVRDDEKRCFGRILVSKFRRNIFKNLIR